MTYLLDTNAVSALMKGVSAVVDRLQSVGRADVAVPQPVLAEIQFGLARMPASRRKTALTERFDLVCGELARAPWTDEVSRAYGHIKATLERKGQRIEDFDAAIAAHALAYDAVLVSADTSHMTRVPGVTVEDWSRVRG